MKIAFVLLSLVGMSFAVVAFFRHSLLFGGCAVLCVFALSCVFVAKQEHKLALRGNADFAGIGEKQAMLFH